MEQDFLSRNRRFLSLCVEFEGAGYRVDCERLETMLGNLEMTVGN